MREPSLASSADPMDARPENVVLVIGLLGSNVDPLARALVAHSLVVPEEETAPPGGSLLVAVTASDEDAVHRGVGHLDEAADEGARPALIVSVTSPLAAVAEDDPDASSLERSWESMRGTFAALAASMPRYSRRLVFQDRLLAEPELELSRLMALFPYELERTQRDQRHLGPLVRTDADQVGSGLPDTPAREHIARVHRLICSRAFASEYDDRELMDEIWLAVGRTIK
jgi:hypothetical protein